MEDAKPAQLPLAVGVELRKAGEELAPAGVLGYQTMIGGQLYLSEEDGHCVCRRAPDAIRVGPYDHPRHFDQGDNAVLAQDGRLGVEVGSRVTSAGVLRSGLCWGPGQSAIDVGICLHAAWWRDIMGEQGATDRGRLYDGSRVHGGRGGGQRGGVAAAAAGGAAGADLPSAPTLRQPECLEADQQPLRHRPQQAQRCDTPLRTRPSAKR